MSMKDAIFGTAAPSSYGGATYRDSIKAWLPVKNIIGGVFDMTTEVHGVYGE